MLSKLKNWISSLFAKKETPVPQEEDLSVYKLKQRAIYYYDNGTEIVKADPMVLYKKVAEVSSELAADMKIARSPSKAARKAHDAWVKKARDILSLKPFSEGGLTEQEAIDQLYDFLYFADFIKKNSRESTISVKETSAPTPPSSEPESPISSSGANGQPTQNTLVSGSTEKEVTTNTQQPLPSEPVSQLAT